MLGIAARLALAALPALVLAHMELQAPLPFRSRFDGANPYTGVDYSMTNPLAADGSNFPCKGYHADLAATPAKATLQAGGTFNVQISGTATHFGGSCEFSISYDGGASFAVIYRIVGGCPLSSSYTIDIPSNLPASKKAILAWSWENNTGNRELYMNCAAVTVVNRDASLMSYTAPSLFRVNSYPDGTCITAEGLDVQYPHVNAVKTRYGGKMSAGSPVTTVANCPRELSRIITVRAADGPLSSSSRTSSSSTSSSRSSSTTRSSTTSTRATSSSKATTSSTKTSTKPVTSTKTSSTARPTQTSGCKDGAIRCGPGGKTWSMCSNGAFVAMGAVAPGTLCTGDGDFIHDPAYVYGKGRL